jgi:hypothetical protein
MLLSETVQDQRISTVLISPDEPRQDRVGSGPARWYL